MFIYYLMTDIVKLPLIEKYMPKNIASIILPDNIRTKITKCIDRKTIENTILAGQNGVGKTLLMNIVSRTILGHHFSKACYQLDTINNRGLKDLSVILPEFCDNYVPDFTGKKLILIDKVDNLTKKAQNLVANIIDDYEDRISFIMTCDNFKKVSTAIIEKCYFLSLTPIHPLKIQKRLEAICIREEIYHTDDALKLISNICNGDIRAAINLLDNINNGYTIINVPNTQTLLYRPSHEEIKHFIQLCIDKQTFLAIQFVKNLKQKGFCSTDILLSIIDTIKYLKFEEHIRVNFTSIITEYYIRMSEELDTELQMYSCISKLVLYENT